MSVVIGWMGRREWARCGQRGEVRWGRGSGGAQMVGSGVCVRGKGEGQLVAVLLCGRVCGYVVLSRSSGIPISHVGIILLICDLWPLGAPLLSGLYINK
jgi:hypothetical protein